MELWIASRFNGPPNSGNGGYVCGAMASAIGRNVRVRLKKPLPLEQTLPIRSVSPNEWHLLDGDEVLAVATSADVAITVPNPPSYDEAVVASKNYPSVEEHELAHCFVCGPARAAGDGLCIFAGPVNGENLVAAPWTPGQWFSNGTHVKPEYVWAALDCPGAFAFKTDKPMLLGELAVRVDRSPNVDEKCVVIGWQIAQEGRKHIAGTAVFGADRALCAVGLATWIELRS